jgi:hypothetical protein
MDISSIEKGCFSISQNRMLKYKAAKTKKAADECGLVTFMTRVLSLYYSAGTAIFTTAPNPIGGGQKNSANLPNSIPLPGLGRFPTR